MRQVKKGASVAVVAGATGLVGSALVERLLAGADYAQVVALARRPLAVTASQLKTVAADFDALDETLRPAFVERPELDVFCCLGTTIKQAGSESAFRRVDYDFVLALGRWAKKHGARRMLVVSALGADPASRVFYNRVKGEMERDLRKLDLRSLTLLRPSLLDGSRPEFRPGEWLALAATRPLRRLIPAGVRPISATDVAQTMIDAARAAAAPEIIESAAMQGASRQSS
jgi:uncharacterized protein YbjT (DUF2867 family)